MSEVNGVPTAERELYTIIATKLTKDWSETSYSQVKDAANGELRDKWILVDQDKKILDSDRLDAVLTKLNVPENVKSAVATRLRELGYTISGRREPVALNSGNSVYRPDKVPEARETMIRRAMTLGKEIAFTAFLTRYWRIAALTLVAILLIVAVAFFFFGRSAATEARMSINGPVILLILMTLVGFLAILSWRNQDAEEPTRAQVNRTRALAGLFFVLFLLFFLPAGTWNRIPDSPLGWLTLTPQQRAKAREALAADIAADEATVAARRAQAAAEPTTQDSARLDREITAAKAKNQEQDERIEGVKHKLIYPLANRVHALESKPTAVVAVTKPTATAPRGTRTTSRRSGYNPRTDVLRPRAGRYPGQWVVVRKPVQ